jgi:hypothetical protein
MLLDQLGLWMEIKELGGCSRRMLMGWLLGKRVAMAQH